MHKKNILLTALILVAVVQISIPAKMILDRENVLKTGTEFKFRTEPVDPNDPFRGKYINLSYKQDTFRVNNKNEWAMGEVVYVALQTDKDGFAYIKSISKDVPSDNSVYVKSKLGYSEGNVLSINYPFDRFYLEESKAKDAEIEFRLNEQDTSKSTYALVQIKNGDAVLKDVLIDGVSVKELVKKDQ